MAPDERALLRRSFVCDCEGESWTKRPLRVIAADDDLGERVLNDCEEACGVRPDGCPWFTFRDPFVAETIRAYGWRELGQLDVKYPCGVPSRIVWGVEVYASALSAVRAHDMRADREEREQERRDQELQRGR